MGCDDEQMVAHITELLVDVDHRQQSSEGLRRSEEGEGEGEEEQADRTNIMDIT